MNRLLIILVLAAAGTHAQIVTDPVPGHVVYGKHGGYTCQPAGALCAVPQTSHKRRAYSWSSRIVSPADIVYTVRVKQDWSCAVHEAESSMQLSCDKPMKEADWPKVASAHIVLDSVQAKIPGNEHVKQCGQTGPNETCWDPSLRHIINHLYGTSKERCEHDEGVPCEEIKACMMQDGTIRGDECIQWVPIGKPVFEDKTPEPEAKPLAVSRDEWSTVMPLFAEDHHGCVYSFIWDEGKQACSMTMTFSGIAAVTCSPLTDGPDPNSKTMVCSYKPETAAPNK